MVHKKKMFCLGDETKIDILDGPSKTYAFQCFMDKQVQEFVFLIKYLGIREDDLHVKVSDFIREGSLQDAYFFIATSDQVAGRFRGFYNADTRKGTLSRVFDQGHN